MAGLWLIAPLVAPFLLLKNQPPTSWSLNSVDLMAVLAGLFLLCFVTGEVLMAMATWLGFSEGRWLVKPSTLNVINSGIVVVAFLPVWRQDLCRYRRCIASKLWIVFFVVSTTLYTGMYGPWFKLLNASRWQSFFVHAAFPAVVIIVAFITFRAREHVGRFRWFVLPVGLAIGFAAVAQCGLASLPGAPENYSLSTAHAVNGALLGLILTLWRESRQWWGGSYVSE